MTKNSDVGTRYLELALQLRRLAPGLVECYTGPESLAAAAESEPGPTTDGLRRRVTQLRDVVCEEVPEQDRRAWLLAQLAGLDTALVHLGGEKLSYRELVRRCHGVDAKLVPEERFAAAHELLAGALPGRGDVRLRAQEWTNSQVVPDELLLAGSTALAVELQRRTRALVALPEEEQVSFELVRDRPWWGNADYLGGMRTRILINADPRTASFRLLELVTHEAYPGHHTEHVCKDVGLIGELGRAELGVYLYPTPQALIAEGIAELAREMLLGDDADVIGARCLRPLGISYDVSTAGVYRRAEEMLLPMRANVAMMLDEGRSAEEIRSYARRWMLEDDTFVDAYIESLVSDSWRPYQSCYAEGLPVCRRFVAGDPARFVRLLQEQLTPHDLDRSL